MSEAPFPSAAVDGGRPLLFDGADVRVVDARSFGSAACVVTFTSWTDELTLEREGFGEAFLRGEAVDAVHVISRDNRWWQYDETLPAMAAVRAAAAGHGRVVAYGSSMGAYAAVRLAGEAGAGVALAMSPQFSILPAVAPFEHRWSAASKALRPVWEPLLPPPRLAEAYLVHDPQDLDGRHVELYARAGMPFTPVRLRHVGHQTAGFLQEVGLLRDVVAEVVAGPADVARMEREAWRRRRRSSQHLLTLAERVHAPERHLELVSRAAELAPGSAALRSKVARALARAGRTEEALEAHGEALALAPGWSPLVLEQALTLRAAGRTAEAAAVLRALAERTGDPAHALLADDFDSAPPPPGRPGGRRVRPLDPGVRPPSGAPPIRVEADESGCVLSGPLRVLRPGRYEVEFGVAPAEARWRPLKDLQTAVAVDVVGMGRRLAERRLSTWGLRLSQGRVRVVFDLPEQAACEFRVFAQGRIALRISLARPCRRLARRR